MTSSISQIGVSVAGGVVVGFGVLVGDGSGVIVIVDVTIGGGLVAVGGACAANMLQAKVEKNKTR
jgi:uncharacterized membrane protein YebE (DUF533 family)